MQTGAPDVPCALGGPGAVEGPASPPAAEPGVSQEPRPPGPLPQAPGVLAGNLPLTWTLVTTLLSVLGHGAADLPAAGQLPAACPGPGGQLPGPAGPGQGQCAGHPSWPHHGVAALLPGCPGSGQGEPGLGGGALPWGARARAGGRHWPTWDSFVIVCHSYDPNSDIIMC